MIHMAHSLELVGWVGGVHGYGFITNSMVCSTMEWHQFVCVHSNSHRISEFNANNHSGRKVRNRGDGGGPFKRHWKRVRPGQSIKGQFDY